MFGKVKTYISLFLCACLVAACATVPASASAKASTIIASHSCEVTADEDGEIAVEFTVSAKNVVSRIGAEYIRFYVYDGGSWTLEKSYGMYNTGMSRTNSGTHSNTMYYQGQTGARYKVEVSLFAKATDGTSDSRSYTKYVNT